MDSKMFDRLSVALSRRGVMRTIAAVFAGGAALAAADESHAAIRGCRTMRISCTRNSQCCSGYCERRAGVPRRDRFRCSCGVGFAYCDGACIELGTDDHCSACGDACTGFDSCISGACIDACTVLTCDVDEECYQGACRKICVSGACATGSICVAGVDLCLPNRCLDDPSKELSGLCFALSDGTIVDDTISGIGDPCITDEECVAYFSSSPFRDGFSGPEWTYGIACVVETVYWDSFQRAVDPSSSHTCAEYVYQA